MSMRRRAFRRALDQKPGAPPSATVAADGAARELGWRAELPFAAGLADLLDDADTRSGHRASASR